MNGSEWLEKQASKLNISLSPDQLDQFARYFEMLVRVNRQMNLTAITEEKEVYVKHFYDSLTLAARLDIKSLTSVIDVGTGAGFPGIPLKIAFPHLRLVLLDSLKKRIHFLNELTEHLGLEKTKAVHGRAEEAARRPEYREGFDLATARAVAKLNVLSEYCLPFVRVGGGRFVAMKGPDIAGEISGAKGAIARLGGGKLAEYRLSLPEGMGERCLIWIEKVKSTPPSYPRRPGIPSKQPLQ